MTLRYEPVFPVYVGNLDGSIGQQVGVNYTERSLHHLTQGDTRFFTREKPDDGVVVHEIRDGVAIATDFVIGVVPISGSMGYLTIRKK